MCPAYRATLLYFSSHVIYDLFMARIPLTNRLDSPFAIAIRAVRGPADLAVVIENNIEGLSLSSWNGVTKELMAIPFDQVTHATTITPDGQYILDLDDPTGSELGHLHATPLSGGISRDLTPGFGSYTIRGIDCAIENQLVLITAGDESGFYAVLSSVENPHDARVVFRSNNEAWSGILSANCGLSALETTDHNPGIRRFGVTVVDNETSEVVATLSDGALGPIRPIRFAQQSGDSRLLASTEVSGFARPLVWDPISGVRTDIPLPSYLGDVVPLDWHSESGRLLLVHVDEGIHRLLEHDLNSGVTTRLQHPEGSFFEPDTGSEFPVIWSSYYAHDGARRLVTSSWGVPLHILESRESEIPQVVLPPSIVPHATQFESHIITSRDGTNTQLWVGLPTGVETPRGVILEVHGGPNLVTVDRYDALAQSWIDDGWAYAALNYRGSVTFGREFRESFWGRVGVGEIYDIDAAINWIESKRLASADSIFITGPSYGGFLTLLALGKLPNRIAGGLAHVAQADWVAAYPQMNPALQAAWRGFVGSDPTVDPTPWKEASPISYVEHVRAPAWLNQGAFDTRTPPKQAQRYVDALRDAGGDVVLDWFQGGHMPGGLAGLAHDYQRMKELTEKALLGQRWDTD
jgi:acetyl esterase/lipase